MLEFSNDFSAEELLHMALNASDQGRHDHALIYLRAHAHIEPDNPLMQLILGSQYAKLRLYDNALSAFERAWTLDNTLYIAQLHSSFIMLAANQYEKAEQVLQPLLMLAEDNYLYSLAKGLIYLCQGDNVQAMHFIELGASQNQEDPLLNNDIEQLLIAIRTNGKSQQIQVEDPNTSASPLGRAANNLLYSTYRKTVVKDRDQ